MPAARGFYSYPLQQGLRTFLTLRLHMAGTDNDSRDAVCRPSPWFTSSSEVQQVSSDLANMATKVAIGSSSFST